MVRHSTFNEDGSVQGFIPQRPRLYQSYVVNDTTGMKQVGYANIRMCYHLQVLPLL